MKTLLQSDFSNEFATTGLMAMGAGFMVFMLALGIFGIICYWRVYTKCGEAGWSILIPIYNLYVWARMVKRPDLFKYMMYGILGFILGAILMAAMPNATIFGTIIFAVSYIVVFVVAIMLLHALSLAFGQSAGFTVGLVFLGIIFIAILAFGNYNYQLNESNASGNDMILDA